MNKIKTILMVEDDHRDAELVMAAFDDHYLKNEVMIVRDGEEALDYLFCRKDYRERPRVNPDMVLLDLKMPKVDGHEVLRQIRSDQELKLVPVIIFTSSNQESDVLKSYQLGTNAYVVKPMNFYQFSEVLKTLVLFWAVLNETTS